MQALGRWFLLAALLLGGPASLSAAEPSGHHTQAEAELEEMPWRMGVRGVGIYAASPAKHESAVLMGISFVGEYALIPRWLEIEGNIVIASAISGDRLRVFGADIHLKVPFLESNHFEAYAGLGPAFAADEQVIGEGAETERERKTVWGAGGALGAYVWFAPHWGIDMELDYNLFFASELVHELAIAVGPIGRF